MDTEFTLTQKRALAVATVVAILFGAYFLRGYFILIVVAAVVAYLFTPLYQSAQQAIRHRAVGNADPVGRDRFVVVPAGPVRVAGRRADQPDGRASISRGSDAPT